MKAQVLIIAGAVILGQLPIDCTATLASEQWGPLTRAETWRYHECLTQAWIEDYCRSNSWGMSDTYDRTFVACIAANGGGRYPLQGRRWFNDIERYCALEARQPAR